jgi:hypothetical protein
VSSKLGEMKPVMPSVELASSAPGYFTYQAPDSGPLIHLSLAALDGMLSEVMTGFGAIPRRGAEVGGILVGKAADAEIWIEGFSMAACEHRRGPSFLLSEQDQEALAKTFDGLRKQEHYPVGLFRSNTRDDNAISDEDRALFAKYFEAPTGTFLLVRPYASKTSTGSFLVYKDGVLPDLNADVFPFQRWELEGGVAPRRRPLHETKLRAGVVADDPSVVVEAPVAPVVGPLLRSPAVQEEAVIAEPGETLAEGPSVGDAGVTGSETEYFYTGTIESSHRRRGWIWIPLSFIFLLLGVLLGFQSALSFYPKALNLDASSFALGLTATAKSDNLYIHWNRESPAIKAAQRGQLEIADGQYHKTVDLDATSLQTGSVVYPPVSNNVSLRFHVIVKGTTSVGETVEWSKN